MKVLVFSDTHLTNKFEEKKYEFLKKIITSADRVIIAGDFWDGASITFDQFINSPWKALFSLLKKKQAVYLFGNHDDQEYCDDRVDLFSKQHAEHYILKTSKQKFYVEHGHLHEPEVFKKFNFLPKYRRFVVIVNMFLNILEEFMILIFGKQFFQKKMLKGLNTETKSIIKGVIPEKVIYVCGHTHSQELDLKNRFINPGIIRHGIGQYLIIENGIPHLMEESYA